MTTTTKYILGGAAAVAVILYLNNRGATTGRSFLGVGTSASTSDPWYNKAGSALGKVFQSWFSDEPGGYTANVTRGEDQTASVVD